MTDLLSSEKIAKALKGAGLSAEQRIAVASEAWHNETLFFPGKDDFILEWLCSALTKPNTKNLSDCSLLQVGYWQLFRELLQHYENYAHDEQKRPPVIRVKLMSAFSIFLQLAYTNTERHTPVHIDLLKNATACLISLLSDVFQYSYRPPFDQLVSAVEQALDALLLQTTLAENNPEAKSALDALSEFAKALLKCFNTQVVQAVNQRKVFTTITGSMFSKLLSLRRQLAASYPQLAQQMTQILLHGLFHPDTILEYTSVLKEVNSGGGSKVFVTKMFEDLGNLAGSPKTEEDALDILPTMYGHFVKIFREKRSGGSRDTYRLVESGFMVEAYNILNKASLHSNRLYCLQKLMHEALTLNTYVASNDDVSRKQFSSLDRMTEYAVNQLSNGDDKTQDAAFRVLDTALQIDFSLLEHRMSALWHCLLNPPGLAWKSCLDFSLSVLDVYTASRQIDSFVQELLTSLYGLDIEIRSLLQSPIFSRDFMDEFAKSVSNHMPPAQAKTIYDDLESRLYDSKLNNVIIHATAFYFTRFITALRISNNQKRAFTTPLQSLFDKWIKPRLSAAQDELLPALQIHTALVNTMLEQYWAMLENGVHEWLAGTLKSIFSKLTDKQTSRDTSCAIALTAHALLQHAYCASLLKTDSQPNQTTDLVNVVLDFCCDGSLLQDDAIWDGLLLSLDEHNVKLACFKLLVDEWFMTTSRFVRGERAEKLASLIFLSLFERLREEKPNNVVSIPVLSRILLRSASFYEASFCKDYAIKILLNAIIRHFREKPQEHVPTKYLSDVDLDLPIVHWSAEQVEVLKNSLDKPHQPQGEEKADVIQLVEILCLFPTEYLSKSERQHALMIAFLLDVWMVTNNIKNIEAARICCRGLLLRIINMTKTAGILETEPSLLDWLVSSIGKENVQIFEETKQIDHLVLSAIIKAAAKKGGTTHARDILNKVLDTRTSWLETDVPNALDWCINAVSAIIEYFERNKARRAEFDPEDSVFAANAISRISSVINSNLQEFKKQLALSRETQSAISFLDRKMFVLATLLQRYAALFNDERANKVAQTAILTQNLTALASPLVQCLQQCPSANLELSNLVANFVASLCNSLAQYNRAGVTERLLAVIWFIYSLALKTGDISCQQSLRNTFAGWIKTLDREQYNLVLDGFIRQSDKTMINMDNHAASTLLALLPTLVCSDTEKSTVLRTNLYILVPRLSVIANKAQSIDTILQVTCILKLLTREQTIHLGTYDISLIISCLAQAANPSTTQHLKTQITDSTARTLYFDICSILSNLLHNHRSHLTSTLSPFVAILQSLLHCFRTAHLALVRDKHAQQQAGRVLPLLFKFAPLDVEAAKDCARLLSAFARKPIAGKFDENIKRAVSRQAPYLLLEYFTIQSNTRMSISQPDIRAALLPGLYDLMDNCRESDRKMILETLDSTGKLLFKSFYSSWKEDHKYTGQ